MSHREIAEELEISEAAAKVRLHRARARLRDGLVAWRPNGSSSEIDDAESGVDAQIIDIEAHRNAS